jgi:hypothetical protein
VFIEALENFGVPFVLAEDRPILSVEAYKLFVGETTDNPASAGVLGVLLVVWPPSASCMIQRGVAARRQLRDRRAPFGAAHRGQPAACAVWPPPGAWIVVGAAGAVRRRGGDFVHEVQRDRCCMPASRPTIRAAVERFLPARSPIRCCSPAIAALRRDRVGVSGRATSSRRTARGSHA